MKKLLFIFIFVLLLCIAKSQSGMMTYKDVQRNSTSIILLFEAGGKSYSFDAAKSNLKPYVFYTTGNDGMFQINDKLKNHRFMVSYSYWPADKTILFITSIREIGVPTLSDNLSNARF